jgi:cytosine deaminase
MQGQAMPAMPAELVLAGATLADGRRADIAIAGGRILAIGSVDAPSAERIDATGLLALPSLVDAHIHLDKTLLGLPFIPHRAGNSVAERIAAEKALRRELDMPVEQRGGALIEQITAFGTGFVRSHVDIDTELGLGGLDSLLRLRESHGHLIDIQIVAFPQNGILRDPGTADLLDQAMRSGADLVGGLDPAGIDADVTGHLDAVFGIASRHGKGVDIHLHDGGSLGAFELRSIAERTIACGLQGQVAVSHAFALGGIDDLDFGRTAALLAEAGIAIVTNCRGPGPLPPVRRLVAAGVTVVAGSDNIRDAWSPHGNGDMLERAQVVADRQGFRDDADIVHALAMASELPARVMGIAAYGIAPGGLADLLLVPAESVPEAVVSRPARRLVLKRGRPIG